MVTNFTCTFYKQLICGKCYSVNREKDNSICKFGWVSGESETNRRIAHPIALGEKESKLYD